MSENYIYEQPQVIILREAILNTSGLIIKIPKLAVTGESQDYLVKGKVTPN